MPQQDAHDQSHRFEEDFSYISALMERHIDDAEEAAFVLEQIYRTLFNVNISKYDIDKVRDIAEEKIRYIFALRLKIREMIPVWMQQGFITPETERALRNVFRATRYATDMLGELLVEQPLDAQAELPPLKAFSGDAINTLANPQFVTDHQIQFLSGDILLMRGSRHNSAAIARIGDNDSQFSHIGLVYVDEANKPWVVEALIEEGAVIKPLDEVLGDDLVRMILLRPKDRELGAASATAAYNVVAKSLKGDHPILYDFSMRLDHYKELFCSKVARLAYDLGSKGSYLLPTFPTNMSMKNRDFLDRIGVQSMTTFAPGDMELEPHFDLVAEWRDYRRTARIRVQDILMDKLFEWMETYQYRFRETLLIKLIARMGRATTFLPKSARTLLAEVMPKVPVNMRLKTVAVVSMLHSTAEPLFTHLYALNQQSFKDKGHPLHPRTIAHELEILRQQRGRQIGYLWRKKFPWT